MPDLRFLQECHADTTLVLFLTKNDSRVIHAPGYTDVGVIMRKANRTTKLIGFVDEDKRIPPYFDDFEIIDSGDKVILNKKLGKDQYLIVIQKAIESFLVWNADQVGIDLTDFGFPKDVKSLGNRLKSLQIEKDENFQTLLVALDNQNAPGFVKIRSILNELVG
ncbi:hypothetical protein [Dyadobacter frigoris]|uniref:Uncharacterized protein n=1 Tax=Dyadobacter frigoris TaxID=2576211 RepID=A0A4U6D4B8_9BACT|nr:hypothetical protein [Dyadobacter frigoris]TKT92092.1 hypothetical protein FDK13_13240 [Dyadobacter frigoris]